jgi:putative transposase
MEMRRNESRRRGCGKCGKASLSCATLFQASCGNPRSLRIPIDASFSTAPRARRFSRVIEETDIRNGKDSPKVRGRLQTSIDRADRSRGDDRRSGRSRAPAVQKSGRALARSISKQRPGRSTIKPGAPIGGRERKAQGQDWRSGDADGAYKKIASLGSAAEKRGYIRDHREELGSVSKACKVSGLAPSSFYYRPDKQHQQAVRDEDEKLRHQIERIHGEFPGYGYRRVTRALKRSGIPVNEKRVRRVMKKFGLRPITWRTFVRTTDSRHGLPIHPNLIKDRQVRSVNEIWVADITYIRIRASFVYLAAILDLYSRKVVGWAISKRIDTELCVAALEMAVEKRPARGCIHHSDRGVQYASASYVALLRQHGLEISMSAKGNPYDNAFMESFYKTLKYEEVHLWNYETYEDVIERLPFFIEEVYNLKRLHSSIGYVPPTEFEQSVLKLKPADRPVLNL